MADVSKIRVDGVDYDVKDSTARNAVNNLTVVSQNATVLSGDSDLNDVVTVGFYTYSAASSTTIANSPKGATQSSLIVLPRLSSNSKTNKIQIVITAENNVYVRQLMDGTWYEWTECSLPSVTSNDNGKILKVVNGVWTAVAE